MGLVGQAGISALLSDSSCFLASAWGGNVFQRLRSRPVCTLPSMTYSSPCSFNRNDVVGNGALPQDGVIRNKAHVFRSVICHLHLDLARRVASR